MNPGVAAGLLDLDLIEPDRGAGAERRRTGQLGPGDPQHLAQRDVADLVGAAARGEQEGVEPAAAVQDIVAGAARQDVGGAVAGDGVGQRVAGAVDRGTAGQGQVLDLDRQGMGDRAVYMIGAAAGRLDHLVAGRVDDVGVVAGAAGHGVGARAAVDHVVAGVSDDGIGQRVAGGVDRRRAEQGQVLDVSERRQGEGDRALHQIGAAARGLDDDIADRVDDEGVVAGPADHNVVAGAAVEDVVAGAALQLVVAGAAIQDIVAAPPVDLIVAVHRIDRVGEFGAVDRVVAIGRLGRQGEQVDRHRRRSAELDELDPRQQIGAVGPEHPVGDAVAQPRHRIG